MTNRHSSATFDELEDSKRSHGAIWILVGVFLVIALAVGYNLYSRHIQPSPSEPILSAESVTGSIANPVGDTYQCDLVFLNMDRVQVDAPTVTHPDYPADPAKNQLQANAEYIVQFDFPTMLLAEIENGDSVFDIAAKYEFEVPQSSRLHVQVKVYNRTSGNLYVANGALIAADDLCIKHSFGATGSYVSRYEQFEADHFAFSLWTSALPDAGPKTTKEFSSGRFTINSTVSGMTNDQWHLPYD